MSIVGKAILLNSFLAYINIYTTANATVTATGVNTGKAYTAVANASGYAQIKVHKADTYNITSTGTTRIGHATITTKLQVVTAYYNWSKYNATAVYSYSSSTPSGGVSSPSQPYYSESGWSFNSANGKFTLTNPRTTGVEIFSPSGYFDGVVSVNGHPSNQLLRMVSGSGFHIYWSNSQITTSGMSTKQLYSSYINSYNRGSYIGVVTSTSLSTYPTNARHSDGYWYVAA